MADFWQNPSLEPKRAFKFVLSIAGGASGAKIPQFLIKKVSKPSFTVSESEHKFLNHSFWFPGKVTWGEVSFTIVDVLGEEDGAAHLMNMLQQAGYSHPGTINADDTNTLRTMSKAKSVGALGQVMIRQIDSGGLKDGKEEPPKVRETWVLTNAWIKDVKFGDLDYDSEDMLNVEVALKYDNAVLQADGVAVLAGTDGLFGGV